MDRKEYDEIKDRFAIFCACWEKGSAKELNQCLKSDAACYLSIETVSYTHLTLPTN